MLDAGTKPLTLNVKVLPEHIFGLDDATILTLICGDTVKLVVTVESHPFEAVNTSV